MNDLCEIVLKHCNDRFNNSVVSVDLVGNIERRLSSLYIFRIDYLNRSRKIIVKKYHSISEERLLSEFKNNFFIYNNLSCDKSIKIPEPLFLDKDLAIVAFEFLDGYFSCENMFKLRSFYLRFQEKIKENYLVGSKLAYFHNETSHFDWRADTGGYGLDFLVNYLTERSVLVSKFLHENKSKEFSHRFDMLVTNRLEEFLMSHFDYSDIPTLVHHDFNPSNVMINKSKIAFIDFSESRLACRMIDVCCYCNYLEMLSLNYPIYSKKRIKELLSSFIEGYTSFLSFDEGMFKIYSLRYLFTNLLTNIYEMKENPSRRYLFSKRIRRYVVKILKTVSY